MPRTRKLLGAAACALVLLNGTLFAADYAQLADEAKASFQPLDESDLAAARSALAQRVIEVERLLNPGTSFGAGWLDYLEWQGVQSQLGPDSEPDLAAARETLRLLGSGAEGLEKPQLQRAADALQDYIGVASFAPAGAERQTRSYELTLDGLAERLSDSETLRSARGSYEAERRLALLAGLESAGEGANVLRAARSEFGQPNLRVEVQSSLLNRLVARPVSDCGPLSDCILGTRINGTGATSGTLSVTTLPALGHARLQFRLTGSTRSNTIGVNGPVQIRSVGDTSFTASQVVELSDRSFSVGSASADATTRTRTQSVTKIGGGLGKRLIERIARKQVAQKKSQADAIASSRAEGRVRQRLEEQLSAEILNARRRYDERFTWPMRRRRATPRSLVQQTTSNSLQVEAVQADSGQLAAWDSPPPAAPAPLSARLHQTAVNNLLDAYLGGATLRRDSVEEPPRIDVVPPPWLKMKAEEPAPGEEFKPWALTFRDPRPISVEIAGGQVKLLIHAARLQVEEKRYDNWDLIATYEAQRVDGRWVLARQGDVEVLPTRFDPASGGRLSSTEVGLRNNLADAINNPPDRVPQELKIDTIDLSERGGAVRMLVLKDLLLENGWASAGWDAL